MAGAKWSDDTKFTEGGVPRIGDKIMGLRSSANYKFDINDGIADGNGNYLFKWATTGAAATDYIQFTNGETGVDPIFEVAGSNSNINLDIKTKGTGKISINTSSASFDTILDEDNMASDSATALATQQSIKAYVDSTTSGFSWTEVTGTTQSLAVNNAYIANNASQVDFTLPSTAAIGDRQKIVGKGAGGWKISQNASQTIYTSGGSTTTGTGGSIESTQQYDAITLVCVTANTDWVVENQVGSHTYT